VEGYLDFKSRPKEYVEARIGEARAEAGLAEEMLRRGLYQNAADKAFMALKALVSALVVSRLDALAKDGRRREWYERVGYAAPTTGLVKIAKDLEALGIKGIEATVKTALMLHRYAYNGFDPNFVDYSDVDEVISDIRQVLDFVERAVQQIAGPGGG
jgi:HEPN domain-containing protein